MCPGRGGRPAGAFGHDQEGQLVRLTSYAPRRITAAAITCTAILAPAGALALASCAAAKAGLPASASRTAGPVIAYVTSGGYTVVPVNTVTNKAGKPIKVGPDPVAIAITRNGKTAYVANWNQGRPQPQLHSDHAVTTRSPTN
jgi:hypothetical protein